MFQYIQIEPRHKRVSLGRITTTKPFGSLRSRPSAGGASVHRTPPDDDERTHGGAAGIRRKGSTYSIDFLCP